MEDDYQSNFPLIFVLENLDQTMEAETIFEEMKGRGHFILTLLLFPTPIPIPCLLSVPPIILRVPRLSLIKKQSRQDNGLCYNWIEQFVTRPHCKFRLLFLLVYDKEYGCYSDVVAHDAPIRNFGVAKKLGDTYNLMDEVIGKGYAKVGDVDSVCELFERMTDRNIISWAAIIAGCAQIMLKIEHYCCHGDRQQHALTINLSNMYSPVKAMTLTTDGGILYGGCTDGYIHY
ncbi:hypothetical protein NE237_032677 [Protea cynaroides]|uniref:Pentatricopeptide repeat-containing protein n=1 Tax=Protea cynaroides TaxID=273540 RepID=A0A9Q0R3S7_9MAGN|nr:hypothetical protein NE237_032677 [Protea cynaroides]